MNGLLLVNNRFFKTIDEVKTQIENNMPDTTTISVKYLHL